MVEGQVDFLGKIIYKNIFEVKTGVFQNVNESVGLKRVVLRKHVGMYKTC